MLVYIINKKGQPLMPCKPQKARKFLREGKATVLDGSLEEFQEKILEIAEGII